MKTVFSEERSTGMGATRYTAVLFDHNWFPVGSMAGRKYHGRSSGYEQYSIDLADDAVTADFYRSNSGNESVRASNGMEWHSFEDADRWAAGETSPQTCPHCGRQM